MIRTKEGKLTPFGLFSALVLIVAGTSIIVAVVALFVTERWKMEDMYPWPSFDFALLGATMISAGAGILMGVRTPKVRTGVGILILVVVAALLVGIVLFGMAQIGALSSNTE